MYIYAGNIHIHSRYSDGSGSIDQIAGAAAAAGLSYIIVTDHETAIGQAEEAINCGVVVLVGVELNRSCNHFLSLGLAGVAPSDETDPQKMIDHIRAEGGLGFIAHPFEKGSSYIDKGCAYPWINWPVFGFNGIEIWNYCSHWRGRHQSQLIALFRFLFNRKGAMEGPAPECLKLWDCYNDSGHRVTAIGGTDAHAFPFKIGFFQIKIFSYRYLFSTINTYILLKKELSGEYAVAKAQILDALREGCCYISFDSLYPGFGFQFYASVTDRSIQMGEETIFEKGMSLRVEVPSSRAVIKLIHNGRLFAEQNGREFACNVATAGFYRVEVYYRSSTGRLRPWIYSNPIYVKPV